jgi:hypothetical protein
MGGKEMRTGTGGNKRGQGLESIVKRRKGTRKQLKKVKKRIIRFN